jgi:hypothetical protein
MTLLLWCIPPVAAVVLVFATLMCVNAAGCDAVRRSL